MEWVAAAIVAAVLAVSVLARAPAELPFTPCMFYNLTGLPCPGCGMTRGFVAMGHGQLAAAWRHNALAPAAFVCCLAYLVWFTVGLARLRAVLRRWWRSAGAVVYALLACAVLASWALSVQRHLHGTGASAPPLLPWAVQWLRH